MKKLLIDNETGIVENIIRADNSFEKSGKTLISYTGQANIGDLYNFISKTFIANNKSITDIKIIALRELEASDKTMFRLIEAVAMGLNTFDSPDVREFVTFRNDLRETIRGNLSTMPDYPKDAQGNRKYPQGT